MVDCLKGFAIVLVVLGHIMTQYAPGGRISESHLPFLLLLPYAAVYGDQRLSLREH